MSRTVDIDLADLLRSAAAPHDGDEISIRILDAASESMRTGTAVAVGSDFEPPEPMEWAL